MLKITQARENLLLLGFVIIALFCLNLNHFLLALKNQYFVYDQDPYMQMVLASDHLKYHTWYSTINHRVNTPFGADVHYWTHVTSAVIMLGTLLLSFFMPSIKAQYLWCFVLPVLFNGIAAFAMLWMIKPLKPSLTQKFFTLMAFLFNPFIYSTYLPLQIDYDFLLVTLSIFYWGTLLRLVIVPQIKWACIMALCAAIGMWTSIAFAIPVLIGLGTLVWLTQIKRSINIKFLLVFMIVLCSVVAIILTIEHPHFLTARYDIISVAHLTFFLLILLGLIIDQYCFTSAARIQKIILNILIVCLIGVITDSLFPGFFYGPYNHIDAYIFQHLFFISAQFHSPFLRDNTYALSILAYFFMGAGFYYYCYLTDKKTIPTAQSIVLFAATIMTGLTIYMVRWDELSAPLNIVSVSFFIHACCHINLSLIQRMLLVMLIALLPATLFFLSKNGTPPQSIQCRQQFDNMLLDRILEKPQFKNKKRIFAHANYGPFLLYYTHYDIVAINDHHNLQGIKDTFDFFTETEQEAQNMIRTRKIDFILLCKAEHLPRFDLNDSRWVQPVPLPEKYSLWLLYQTV